MECSLFVDHSVPVTERREHAMAPSPNNFRFVCRRVGQITGGCLITYTFRAVRSDVSAVGQEFGLLYHFRSF